jgi:hypothetical protein
MTGHEKRNISCIDGYQSGLRNIMVVKPGTVIFLAVSSGVRWDGSIRQEGAGAKGMGCMLKGMVIHCFLLIRGGP